jgi:hypothetical protein
MTTDEYRELAQSCGTFLGFARTFFPTLLLLAALLFAAGYAVGRAGTNRYVPVVPNDGTVQVLDTHTGKTHYSLPIPQK